MKLALAMIVKAADSEAEVLDRCLANVAPHVDDIFITITGQNDKVFDVAQKYNAFISYFEWVNDFAAARNYNFSQVPQDYEYILWLDADDVVRGIENLKKLIEKNKADAYVMNYLYAFDEWKNPIVVHRKTQVLRNDGCVAWVGKLHEDFNPTRQLDIYFIKDIERIHLTDDSRIASAKNRNVEVAKVQLDAEPNDPRSFWNLGNALKAAGKDEEAIVAFTKFNENSRSDEERYIIFLRLAEIYWTKGDKATAIEFGQRAVGLRPNYPDAYNLLGSLYLENDQLYEAREMLMTALTKKPPYDTIIVYNPRDYDYTPLMNLAKVYFGLSQPLLALDCLKSCQKIYPKSKDLNEKIRLMEQEAKKFSKALKQVNKLKKIKSKERLFKRLAALDPEIQAHPVVCHLRNINFVKTKSSGKDLVIYCAYTKDIWNPEIAKTRGIGGSEEHVIHIAKRLANKGWNVVVYNNCGHIEQTFGGVTYKPFWMWNYRDRQDVVILWRHPVMAKHKINSDVVVLDMHDVIDAGEFTKERLQNIDKIFVKTNFHRSLYPAVPDEKFVVNPNGIEPEIFNQTFERDPYLMINTSSPDRSISKLLALFKRVKEQVPQAKMKWAYGWGVFDEVHSGDRKVMEWKKEILDDIENTPDFEALGRIGHEQVANLYLQANVFAYPTEFAEIHCISAVKAQAAGAIPVTTDFAALNETVQYGTKIKSPKTKDTWSPPYKHDFSMETGDDEWVRAVVQILKNPPSEAERMAMRQWAKETYDWDKIAEVWNATLEEICKVKKS